MPFLKPLGIGDLIVLKKRLFEYRPGEIAHIENVMASEERNRFHRRLNRIELTTETEVEREEERKRDLESTERFELEQEIKNETKTHHKVGVGAEVSGGLGPVQISAYAKYDFTSSTEASEKTAQKYAKEITERAIERIRESARQLRKSVELEETEEKNEHKFKNESGAHIAGVYRWVDKYYLVKPLNYGKRLFYEFVVPEPAAGYVFAKTWSIENNSLPEKPDEPKILKLTSAGGYFVFLPSPLQPHDLNATNYMSFVAQYGAENIKPPPKEKLIVSHSVSKELDGSGDFVLDGEDVAIPEGYEASLAVVSYVFKSWRSHSINTAEGYITPAPYAGLPPYFKLHFGREIIVSWQHLTFDVFATETPQTIRLNRETGLVPISGVGNYVGALAMNIEIECERSAEVYQKWQLETYQAILTAYRKQLSKYEEQLAAARITGGVQISGDSPDRNLMVIKEELQKGFIDLWMRDDYRVLPGRADSNSSASPPMWPSILSENAESNSEILHFLHEAFDWENISFQFMPYYAGHQSNWLELAGYSDPDPLFESFLKAGAALVRVPVQPKYTHAVLYYQLTDRIWSRFAGDVPALTTLGLPEAQVYNSYLEAVSPDDEDTDIFNTDTISKHDRDVFEVKVPTQLVWLQSGNDLNPSSSDER